MLNFVHRSAKLVAKALGPTSTEVQLKKEEDWEKARDWLANERVTKMSAKVPSLAEIQSKEGLYNYLKDGTELCRVIGTVTNGQLPEGIIYR